VGVLGSWPPHFLAVWGPSVYGPPTFYCRAAIGPTWPLIHSISSAISVRWFLYLEHQRGFCKADWLYKLHQHVWQRVSGLCPDPLGSPREGRKKGGLTDRMESGGLRPEPPRFVTDRRHWCHQMYNTTLGVIVIKELALNYCRCKHYDTTNLNVAETSVRSSCT